MEHTVIGAHSWAPPLSHTNEDQFDERSATFVGVFLTAILCASIAIAQDARPPLSEEAMRQTRRGDSGQGAGDAQEPA